MRSFKYFILFFLFLGVMDPIPRAAHATIIDWDFSASFTGDAEAKGKFSYNSVTGGFSKIRVELEGGALVADRILTGITLIDPRGRGGLFVDPADGPTFPMDAPALFLSSMTGFDGIQPFNIVATLATCVSSDCMYAHPVARAAATATATPATVPEPTTFFLLGSGLLGLAGYRWHQRRREEAQAG